MRSVKHYETSDGKYFDSSEEALDHERELVFCQAYDADPIREDITGEQVAAWLLVNKAAVQDLFRKHPKKEKSNAREDQAA